MVEIDWLGGLINITIPEYIIVGVILMVVGLLIASFLPIHIRKYGLIMFGLGLIMAVGFRLVENWWQNDFFRIGILSLGVFGIMSIILFPNDGVRVKK